ncbi:alpha/beta fold hydrolase [Yinghuangia seranimata]|uniref:alpha/beta fold hydrolase n=1 Tax=Yinghuangia seranimata TaxID=408067 RepID=UPI00248ABEDD|nr:alpha/beta hydrolase [Yinghuangia seranimata]MDI2130434.1 alpha/beta hydrolase [Yinghuangia seranimata]
MTATLETYKTETATLAVAGTRIQVRTQPSAGAARPLVLVHGTGGGSGMWDPLLGGFSDRGPVVLPDLSGSDTAEDDGGPLTLDLLAAQVVAAIEATRGPVDLLGFSLGAAVAAAAAAARPDLVENLVLVSGWASPDDEYIRNMMTVWRDLADKPETFGRFATFTAFSRDHLNRIGREAVEQATAFMRPTPPTLRQIDFNLTFDARAHLRDITARTLVVGGAQDATIPVGNQHDMHKAIPGSRYAEFDTGHIVVYERMAEFTRLVREFLDGE